MPETAALTPANVRLAINKVRKSLGINQVGKLNHAYTSVEQEHAWKNLGINISQIVTRRWNDEWQRRSRFTFYGTQNNVRRAD